VTRPLPSDASRFEFSGELLKRHGEAPRGH
jgi:hypothetical protein